MTDTLDVLLVRVPRPRWWQRRPRWCSDCKAYYDHLRAKGQL